MKELGVSKKNTCEVSKLKAQQEENSNTIKLPKSAKSARVLAVLIFGSVLQAGCAMSPATEEAAEPVVEAAAQVKTSTDAAAVKAKSEGVEKAKVAVPEKSTPKIDSKVVKAEQEAKQRKAAELEALAKKARAQEAEAKAAEVKANAEKASADAMMSSLAAKDKYAVITAEAPAATKKKETKATPTTARKALVKKPLNVGLKDLPVTIGLWSVARNLNDNTVHITTPTWQMGDGSYLSQIWITLEEDRMVINSSSDIDAKGNGSGVVLNGGELIPYTRIEDHNKAVLEGEWMQRLSDGGKLEIYMGFFPGKTPRSPTYKSDASLDALSRLVPTYEKLSK